MIEVQERYCTCWMGWAAYFLFWSVAGQNRTLTVKEYIALQTLRGAAMAHGFAHPGHPEAS